MYSICGQVEIPVHFPPPFPLKRNLSFLFLCIIVTQTEESHGGGLGVKLYHLCSGIPLWIICLASGSMLYTAKQLVAIAAAQTCEFTA